MEVYRCGDVVMAESKGASGHQQKGMRPWLIVSNNIGNKFSPMYNAIPFTTKRKTSQPTHVAFKKGEAGLPSDSTLLCELEMPINKIDCTCKLGAVETCQLREVACAMAMAKPIVLIAFQNNIQSSPVFQKVALA